MATGRNARTADAMEKARLRQEHLDIAANTPPAPAARTDALSRSDLATAKAKRKQKKKEPEYFTVPVPGVKVEKKATKKTSSKSAKTRNASKT
jgi:hypothetical protein